MNPKLAIITLLAIFFSAIVNAEIPAPLKVGISIPLSGDLTEYGVAVKNGIELAQLDDGAGYKQVEFIFEDNRYDAKESVTIFNKFLEQHNVSLIYNWGEHPLHAVAPLAERRKIPLLAMSFDASPSIGKRYVIRTANHSAQFAKVLIDYLSLNGHKKIAMLKAEDPFFNSMIQGLRAHLRDDQSLEELFVFQQSDNDFKSPISRLKSLKYDIIGIYLFPGQVSTFYRQAFQNGYLPPSFGTDIFESTTEIAQSQGHMEGAVYPNMEATPEFLKSYITRYGNDIQTAYAYNGYVVANVIRDLSNKVSITKTGGILDSLEELTSNDKERYPFRFKNNKDGGKYWEFPIVIKKITGETFKTVWNSPTASKE